MRSPRREFATPFVITLAAAAPACANSSPAPVEPQPAASSPAAPVEPQPAASNPATPEPEPAKTEEEPPLAAQQAWKLQPMKDGTCVTQGIVSCAPAPGASCNPPPSYPYECPKDENGRAVNVSPSATLRGHVGAKDCELFLREDCPEGWDCNPPPPIRVPCPRA